MHVFCPDCNAKYKVNERSSLTKTVKFVCIECENSWVDKFEKLEQIKKVVPGSRASISGDVIDTTNKESGPIELNSLAFEEVQNSFGNYKSRIEPENNNSESEHTFEFETVEAGDEFGNEGPSKTFPKIRSNKEEPGDNKIEERNAKEIEIEKRLKESSELLKKAKQPHIEQKETIRKEKKPKNRKVLVALSIFLVISFFTYNFTILFLEEILRELPFAADILSQISRSIAIFSEAFLAIIENIMNVIPNLA